jgi:iron(III) transport system substrate-binding protein
MASTIRAMGRAGALAVALALLAAACGGSSEPASAPAYGDVLAAVEGLDGDAREQKLLELAEAEGGKLIFYSSYASDLIADIGDAFEEAYGIDVAVYRAQTADLQLRLIQEYEAGFAGADVVETGGLEMVDLAARSILQPYASPSAGGLVDGAVREGWTSDSLNTLVLTWNPDLLAPGDVPRSWEELADPAWKGKLALDVGDVEWYTTLRDHWLSQGKAEEEVDRLFGAIAANAFVVKGHSAGAQLQAAGEFPLFVNFKHLVERLARDGAPIAWEPPVEPVVTKTDGVAPIASAAHPASALLFVDWLLSDGQEILAEYGVATRRDLSSVDDVETAYVDLAALGAGLETWSDRFEELLRRGTPVEDGG